MAQVEQSRSWAGRGNSGLFLEVGQLWRVDDAAANGFRAGQKFLIEALNPSDFSAIISPGDPVVRICWMNGERYTGYWSSIRRWVVRVPDGD